MLTISKSKEEELYDNNRLFVYDNRKPECVSIYRTDRAIWITNHHISEYFFAENRERSNAFYNFFGKPDLMFAFNRYDSGGTYGYTKEGVNIRELRVISYEKEIEKGSPLPIELDWFNAKTEMEYLGDGEYQKNYINPKSGYGSCSEDSLAEVLLGDLMMGHLGVSADNLYDKAIERSYYRIHLKPNKASPVAKQSWWKRLFS